ncbi:MAG: LuxR C-terminal-related transcriptional regulator, partial [Gammaproteobacteria bacterium]|nr:LuxR C-terminal-related transcriptional regulator [Gammaproteobacteria bacterium]
MNNSRFSSLIYRIIGKPERWHDDYIDMMHQILDETESFDDPYNFSELAVGDQIISQLKASNEALAAFNTLLDKSRFKMIILDDQLQPIYHNRNAEELFEYVLSPSDRKQLRPGLARQIQEMPRAKQNNKKNTLQALDFFDQNGEQIYLRTIQSQVDQQAAPNDFIILMALDQSHEHNELNADLIAKYELTEKEQMVLRGLIHGKSIKEIAADSFVSDNTVKTHLKSIFRKTDTNSQTAVVGMILTHESQILDSYFESDIGGTGIFESNTRDRSVTLTDGLVITYCEYGPADGRPLLVFHSGYGCRLSVPMDHEEACQRHNRRVIIPDRPGV